MPLSDEYINALRTYLLQHHRFPERPLPNFLADTVRDVIADNATAYPPNETALALAAGISQAQDATTADALILRLRALIQTQQVKSPDFLLACLAVMPPERYLDLEFINGDWGNLAGHIAVPYSTDKHLYNMLERLNMYYPNDLEFFRIIHQLTDAQINALFSKINQPNEVGSEGAWPILKLIAPRLSEMQRNNLKTTCENSFYKVFAINQYNLISFDQQHPALSVAHFATPFTQDVEIDWSAITPVPSAAITLFKDIADVKNTLDQINYHTQVLHTPNLALAFPQKAFQQLLVSLSNSPYVAELWTHLLPLLRMTKDSQSYDYLWEKIGPPDLFCLSVANWVLTQYAKGNIPYDANFSNGLIEHHVCKQLIAYADQFVGVRQGEDAADFTQKVNDLIAELDQLIANPNVPENLKEAFRTVQNHYKAAAFSLMADTHKPASTAITAVADKRPAYQPFFRPLTLLGDFRTYISDYSRSSADKTELKFALDQRFQLTLSNPELKKRLNSEIQALLDKSIDIFNQPNISKGQEDRSYYEYTPHASGIDIFKYIIIPQLSFLEPETLIRAQQLAALLVAKLKDSYLWLGDGTEVALLFPEPENKELLARSLSISIKPQLCVFHEQLAISLMADNFNGSSA